MPLFYFYMERKEVTVIGNSKRICNKSKNAGSCNKSRKTQSVDRSMERNQTNVCIFGQVCPGKIYRFSTETEKQTEEE